MPIIDGYYVAPDPTPEQKANGTRKNYDPWDRGGDLAIWDLAANDVLAAACLIHDEMYLEGGDKNLQREVDANFFRDSLILAKAASLDSLMYEAYEIGRARLFSLIVTEFGAHYWKEQSLNTEETRKQGAEMMAEAKQWINSQAELIGEPMPYPEAMPLLAHPAISSLGSL